MNDFWDSDSCIKNVKEQPRFRLLTKPSYFCACHAQPGLSREDCLLFRFTAKYSVGKLPELECSQMWGPGEAHVQASLYFFLPVHPEAWVCLEWAVSRHQLWLPRIASGLYVINGQAEQLLTVATTVSSYMHSSYVLDTVFMGCAL